jgi:uncharacterized protein
MTKRAIVEFDVPMPARDGTILRADVMRPDTDEPVPAILMRNPYPPAAARQQLDQLRAVSMGFAIVAQSCRGTSASDGSFEPWVMEESDGVDAVAWCAAQPWSTGKVAMFGGSYLAHTQSYAAAGLPPALVAIAPSIAPSSPYDLTYNGGALCLSSLGWALGMAFMRLMRAAQAGEDVMADFMELGPLFTMPFDELCRTAPLRDLRTLHRIFPAFEQWLDHPTYDDWWHGVSEHLCSGMVGHFRTGFAARVQPFSPSELADHRRPLEPSHHRRRPRRHALRRNGRRIHD